MTEEEADKIVDLSNYIAVEHPSPNGQKDGVAGDGVACVKDGGDKDPANAHQRQKKEEINKPDDRSC